MQKLHNVESCSKYPGHYPLVILNGYPFRLLYLLFDIFYSVRFVKLFHPFNHIRKHIPRDDSRGRSDRLPLCCKGIYGILCYDLILCFSIKISHFRLIRWRCIISSSRVMFIVTLSHLSSRAPPLRSRTCRVLFISPIFAIFDLSRIKKSGKLLSRGFPFIFRVIPSYSR